MREIKNQFGRSFVFFGDEPADWVKNGANSTAPKTGVSIYKPVGKLEIRHSERKERPGFWKQLKPLGFTETVYTENSIRTYTGKVFDLKIMDPKSICIEDIAHALSHTNRFGGHLEKPYSVAQHSVLAAYAVPPGPDRLAALLHDATEAYLPDMPSPFKKMMPEFKEIENRLMAVIAAKFLFAWPLPAIVKKMDMFMLDCEWASLVIGANSSITYWPAERAEKEFLDLYWECMKYNN